ncbi:hypothetical protein RhiirA5_429942 [Rhizophagus irregularis]|uniref:Crinkler effector protein N-terminal domain-containing protein n=4 Tax=Rhizophagus irregularis TaxID=588596 RepID=A0A2N0NXL1_9GLOM|nr:hypothetical protein GLOIN_2v1773324 [Rhizophagus irregularis DAOM 181602=DAOM 197198]PKB99300.1 hypothetical protein RhiirA5_429942 [Rhizophagus irregularis]POG72683.1 hypothetical protein GLOIN_2v1773324 [Rhizophagus irregularis DAOM 181602=DAOM 197198]|eukprot:XP_025179549.1 hypothetical protein GLOIN_2v1773324 [Rhizophagus irregularis DAOM 181602=DAOM 197198]
MELSLNCFVLGSRNTFTANVPKKYINESNLTVIEYTVSNFKEIIKNQVKHAVPDPEDPNSMELWLVDIDDGSLKNISTEKDIENKFNGKRMKFPVTDTPNKRIKLEDIGIGLIQDKTTEYLQELLCPFDEPVDFFEFLPGVMLTVGNAMKLYKGKKNQEMETSYMVDNVIRKMLKLADKYIGTFGLEWARNNKTNDFTTTTDKDVLVIMGEEKATNSTFATAAADLDYYYKFWNMLALGELPLVIAFAAVDAQIQFYYYHVVESSTTPKRIGDVLSLGTKVKRTFLQFDL